MIRRSRGAVAALLVWAVCGSIWTSAARAQVEEGSASAETLATEAPATEALATETPVTETPATETPVTETPVTDTGAAGPPRSLEARYADALAGTWAASGVSIGGVGLLSMLVGLSVGCSVDGQLGCGAGAAGGAIAGASVGWLVGPLIGTSLGAGLEPLEGLGVWALGLGTNLALVGVGAAIGYAVDATQHTWGLGRVWGLILGVSLGALAQMFLTPLYAVLLFGDRSAPAERASRVIPFLVPSEGGLVGGVSAAL